MAGGGGGGRKFRGTSSELRAYPLGDGTSFRLLESLETSSLWPTIRRPDTFLVGGNEMEKAIACGRVLHLPKDSSRTGIFHQVPFWGRVLVQCLNISRGSFPILSRDPSFWTTKTLGKWLIFEKRMAENHHWGVT